jgi:hypothetical protein
MKYPQGLQFKHKLLELAKWCTERNLKKHPTFHKILAELTMLERKGRRVVCLTGGIH